MRDTYTSPSVWLLCTFFFFYIGAVLTAGGWIVEYLVKERDGDLSTMGYVPAGFSGGTLLGRLLLAEPTHRYGSRKMLTIYIALSVALQLLFWL
jgi:fucose permease